MKLWLLLLLAYAAYTIVSAEFETRINWVGGLKASTVSKIQDVEFGLGSDGLVYWREKK